MENKFLEKMALKSDDELKEMLKNNHKYVPEALEAAVFQLTNRGVTVDGSEQIIQESKIKEADNLVINDKWDTHQHVEGESAPLLYSKRVIYGFSLFFSVLFGAVLMVINLRSLNKPEGVVPTISFSIGYFLSMLFLFDFLESHYKIVVPNNSFPAFLGAWLILELIWNKYIGKEIKYRKKDFLKPLIVGVVVIVVIVMANIYSK